MQMDLDVLILGAAGPDHGLVTRDRLLALGATADQIDWRVRAGALVRVQPSVFALAGAPNTFEQRALAACWSASPGGALSHGAAARVWGLRGAHSDRIDVTVPRGRRPSLTGVRVHRSGTFDAVDRRSHDGITLTRPERTLVDCAASCTRSQAAGFLESAVHRRLTTVEHVWRYLSRYGGHGCRGAGRLRAVLGERDPQARPTESGLEDLALRVLRRYGCPDPVRQHRIAVDGSPGIRIDFAYPPVRLAIEVDSAVWHSDGESYRRDRAKWNLLTRLGWTLVIVTEFDLHEQPERVGSDVESWLRRLSHPFSGAGTGARPAFAPKNGAMPASTLARSGTGGGGRW